jgi:hypothetical protein
MHGSSLCARYSLLGDQARTPYERLQHNLNPCVIGVRQLYQAVGPVGIEPTTEGL